MATASAHYDLIVIGSGPSAQKCALDSAQRGKKVAVVDKGSMLGGVCVHTGTIPSKTFREAVLHLTGYRHQGFYGPQGMPSAGRISIPDLLLRVKKVETGETSVIIDQLRRDNVEIISGTARFLERVEGKPNRVIVLRTGSPAEAKTSVYRHIEATLPTMTLSADKFLVACGTRPLRRSDIPFDGTKIFDSDQLLWGGVKEVPRDLIVVGAGVIGIEYASMMNAVPGTRVYVIDPRPEILGFADREVIQALTYTMRKNGARFLLGEKIKSVEVNGDEVIAHLQSGKRVVGDAMLYTMGRQGNTDSLSLETVGVKPDDRGLLKVNDYYQTVDPSIYACGDIIGYPALASTSMEQGRRAAMHMWDGAEGAGFLKEGSAAVAGGKSDGGESEEEEVGDDPARKTVKSVAHPDGSIGRSSENLFPYGIYTIPEISMVGKTEAQLTAEGVSYEVGVANYQELAKGQMLGGVDGFLKLIFDTESLQLLGVHCFGDGATEIIHIGQVVISQGGSVEYFRTAVFNYPTLAEAYNVAAHDGLRKVGYR